MSYCLNQFGLVAQFVGAAYLVLVAFGGRRTFGQFNTDPTYGELGNLLREVINAQRRQFRHQLIAFTLLAVGVVAELVANGITAPS